MSSYRTLLPPVDPRRAAALRAQLLRLASALTPRWVPTGERGDFASALLAIAARLGEETTRRLDQTAERDPVAFFDFLGLPPLPPRAATGVLAMALADGVTLPVFAPERTQATVAVKGGGEVPFETSGGLRVVPGRLAELIAVDPAADRIEQAPAQVTAAARPTPAPASYAVLNPAGAGSQSVQLSPAVGLAAADLLRIGTAAYRIAAIDKNSGIVTLLDPLEAPVAADATVSKIASFPTFNAARPAAARLLRRALDAVRPQGAHRDLAPPDPAAPRAGAGRAPRHVLDVGHDGGRLRARLAPARAARHHRRHARTWSGRTGAPSRRSRSTAATAAGCAPSSAARWAARGSSARPWPGSASPWPR